MKILHYQIHPVKNGTMFGLYQRIDDGLEWLGDYASRNEAAIKAVGLGLSASTTFTLHQE